MLPTNSLKLFFFFFFSNEQQLIRFDELLYISNRISCIKILVQFLILSIISLSSGFFFSLTLRCFFFSFLFSFLSFSHSLCCCCFFFSHKPNEIRKIKEKKKRKKRKERDLFMRKRINPNTKHKAQNKIHFLK